jgi:NADH-quinone oxidoreductase subunit L
MFTLLWLVPALPFAGFIVLALVGSRLPRPGIAAIGVGSAGLSAALALWLSLQFLLTPPPNAAYAQTLWIWLQVGHFAPGMTLYLDALSVVMMVVVTFVAFLIHLYSAEHMEAEEGYSRFFAYLNLFVGAMLVLVLADNLFLLYLGWEGVGACSYLLIGFWYQDPANGRAARKAFVVTRIGDTALAIGLFLLFSQLGTLQIQPAMQRAVQQWPVGSGLAIAAAALLLGGALGKSAQLPLQTWLPDAMAGPSPVSALIHAATMVTAGVYLIARTHALFTLAPTIQFLVALIGALTLLLAGFSALTQRDLKRVLAYSTISQIGYMFLALGVGAWSAAIFHFMTHAFFKALLFLGAGVVIAAVDDEHDMFKMGGLRRLLPATFWTFLIGASSLAALPFITAGFYSKDLILWEAWASPSGSTWLWAAGLAGALLTGLYTFRMVFVIFFGEPQIRIHHRPGLRSTAPLIVLSMFAVLAGFAEWPQPFFSTFLQSALPALAAPSTGSRTEWAMRLIASLASLIGLAAAYWLYAYRRDVTHRFAVSPLGAALRAWWLAGWGFDALYQRIFVLPYVWLARQGQRDVLDLAYTALARLVAELNHALSRTQTGRVNGYLLSLAAGTAIIIAVMLLLR